jgi:hypothetical protein
MLSLRELERGGHLRRKIVSERVRHVNVHRTLLVINVFSTVAATTAPKNDVAAMQSSSSL